MTTEDEAGIRAEALRAIKEKTQEALSALTTQEDVSVAAVDNKQQDAEMAIQQTADKTKKGT